MKEVKTVGVIGLGSLGILYTHLLTKAMGRDNVLVLADSERIARYRRDGIYFNDQLCDYN